jgi:FMN phosphatase YigB (HAD superfamily)
MARPYTIIWDIDDVLNELTLEWFESAWLPSHSGCLATYADLQRNPPHDCLGATLAEYLESLDAFRRSEHGRNLRPRPEALAWFEQQGASYRHIALTARPMESAGYAAEWVISHFGKWIRTFGFVPSHRAGQSLPPFDMTKAEWIAALGAGDVLVDDSESNVEGATRLGLSGIVVPQPWNSAPGHLNDALDQLSTIAPCVRR